MRKLLQSNGWEILALASLALLAWGLAELVHWALAPATVGVAGLVTAILGVRSASKRAILTAVQRAIEARERGEG